MVTTSEAFVKATLSFQAHQPQSAEHAPSQAEKLSLKWRSPLISGSVPAYAIRRHKESLHPS